MNSYGDQRIAVVDIRVLQGRPGDTGRRMHRPHRRHRDSAGLHDRSAGGTRPSGRGCSSPGPARALAPRHHRRAPLQVSGNEFHTAQPTRIKRIRVAPLVERESRAPDAGAMGYPSRSTRRRPPSGCRRYARSYPSAARSRAFRAARKDEDALLSRHRVTPPWSPRQLTGLEIHGSRNTSGPDDCPRHRPTPDQERRDQVCKNVTDSPSSAQARLVPVLRWQHPQSLHQEQSLRAGRRVVHSAHPISGPVRGPAAPGPHTGGSRWPAPDHHLRPRYRR
jgi:hypothetical protein